MNLKNLRRKWRQLGPGLITGASDDDPSGIATYSQAGASFGYSTLWTALLTYPLMYIVQEMCAIGIVSSASFSKVIKTNYPKFFIYLLLITMFPAITFNIAADIAGMGAVANLLIPSVPNIYFEIILTLLILSGLIFFKYRTMVNGLKYLSLVLFVYFFVPFFVKQDIFSILKGTFIPSIRWDFKYISILVALLGTTISPYLFFWQSAISKEEKEHHINSTEGKEIKMMKGDVNIGMLFSNLVMFFIILTCGSVLHPIGIQHIETVEQAAEALKPLAGNFAYSLFALGVIGSSFLAIPVLAGCLGYIFADTFDWEKGMDKKAFEAKEFYTVIALSLIIALGINFFNIDPIKSLIITAIIYGITAPFLIAIILHICNQKKIMGNYTNKTSQNILGIITLLIMSSAVILLLFV